MNYEQSRKYALAHFERNKSCYIDLYESINEHLTPDFSAKDWIGLHKQALEGDSIAGQMLMSLWKSKVDPHVVAEMKLSNFKEQTNKTNTEKN